MATATAPPSIRTISLPILAAAAPDCRPGWPAVVVEGLAPAVPLGVGAAEYGAGTTVTAVMVLWLPFGSTVVSSTVEVTELEDPASDAGGAVVSEFAAAEEGDDPPEGDRVTTPPPTVLMTVTPATFVVVMTLPGTKAAVADCAGVDDLVADDAALDCAFDWL